MTDKFTIIPEETFRIFSPILHLSRIYCLQPLQWKQMKSNYVIIKSTTYLIYSNVMTVILAISTIITLSLLLQTDELSYLWIATPIQCYITYSEFSMIIITSVVGALITSLKIDKYINYMNLLNQADQLLQKHPSKYWKHLSVAIATTTYAWTTLILDMVTWLSVFKQDRNIYTLIFLFIPIDLCYYFTVVIELLYWQLVYSIKSRLTEMNKCLVEISNNRNFEKNTAGININRKQVFSIASASSNTLNKFRDLFKVYDCLKKATNHVNDCYGFLILIVFVGCLVFFLITPFDLYNALVNTNNKLFVVSYVMWACGHILRLFLIVEPCHNCSDEVSNTLEIVCNILSSDLSEEIKEFLQNFALYLSQCKIEFTAFGLMKLNRGLLSTVTATITTYWVIIFQFYSEII